MNFSFWWPVGLVVMAGVGYQVSAKEVAGGADPLAALVVTYLVASLTSFLIYAFTGKKGEKWKEIMSFRPAALEICKEMGITLEEVAYVGDDINCIDLLSAVGFPACPSDAHMKIVNIQGIKILNRKGGAGWIREFVDILL